MIDRRVFLKGLGAAVGAAVMGASLVSRPKPIAVREVEFTIDGHRFKLKDLVVNSDCSFDWESAAEVEPIDFSGPIEWSCTFPIKSYCWLREVL